MQKRIITSLSSVSTLVAFPLPASHGITNQSGITNLGDAVTEVFKILIFFLPTVAVIYIVFAGYRYMVAQGNPDLTERAKKSLTYGIIGLIVALSSVSIIVLIGNQLGFDTGLHL